MTNNIFVALFLIAFVCLIAVLVGIYQKIDPEIGRFQASGEGVLDTKNGLVYYNDQWGQFIIVEGEEIYIKKKKLKDLIKYSLPKN